MDQSVGFPKYEAHLLKRNKIGLFFHLRRKPLASSHILKRSLNAADYLILNIISIELSSTSEYTQQNHLVFSQDNVFTYNYYMK